MARRVRRAGNVASNAMSKRARWRVQVNGLALLGGLVGGAGCSVLAQQYAIAPLTIGTLGLALVAGLAVAVVLPSCVFAVAVAVHNRGRRRRARAGAVLATVAILAMVAALLVSASGPAGAAVEGPCLGEVNGTDVTQLPVTKNRAIDLADDRRLHVVLRSLAAIASGRLAADYGGANLTLRNVPPEADLSPDPQVLEYEFDLGDATWMGAGLYEISAVADLGGAGTCTARFVVSAGVDPLSTLPGRLAAGAVLLGALLVLASTVGSARSLRVRSLDDLRRSFDALQTVRSSPAGFGLPAGPAWNARLAPAGEPAPLPESKSVWWRDDDPPARDDATSTEGLVEMPRRTTPTDEDDVAHELAPVIEFGPRLVAEPAVHDDACETDDDVAPVLALGPRALDAESGFRFRVPDKVDPEPEALSEPEGGPEQGRRWFAWTDERDEPPASPDATDETTVTGPSEPEHDDAPAARLGTFPVARSVANHNVGAGVLGPPTPGFDPAIGEESVAALERWSVPAAGSPVLPHLERDVERVLKDLQVGLVTRGRLSAAIDRTALRTEAEQWVERVGRPPAPLEEARTWRAPLSDEVLGALLTPSPHVAQLARRVAAPTDGEHDWDLCVQEVVWPWA